MGTPFGRQSSKTWEDVRKWDKETAKKLTYTVAGFIRNRFPHDDCSHERCCEQCRSLIELIVTKTREQHEQYVGNKLSDLLNIRCPFPHHGGD